MKGYLPTPDARLDVLDIADYVARDNLMMALRIINEIESAFAFLGENPTAGHFREDILSRRFRVWSVYSYLVVYRWEMKPIEIIAVIHGARNLPVVVSRRRLT